MTATDAGIAVGYAMLWIALLLVVSIAVFRRKQL
jgi:hypothetical protein